MVDLRKLKGGAKHKYLREHRREILGYLSTHGEYKTLEKYGTTVRTLDRLIRDNNVTEVDRVTDIERVMLSFVSSIAPEGPKERSMPSRSI